MTDEDKAKVMGHALDHVAYKWARGLPVRHDGREWTAEEVEYYNMAFDKALGTAGRMNSEIKQFSIKCDHCPWAGIIADATVVNRIVTCPRCGGSVAANDVANKVVDLMHQYLNLDDVDY